MSAVTIRAVTAADFDAWLPLWRGYQVFYKTDIDEATTRTTWQRLLAPTSRCTPRCRRRRPGGRPRPLHRAPQLLDLGKLHVPAGSVRGPEMRGGGTAGRSSSTSMPRRGARLLAACGGSPRSPTPRRCCSTTGSPTGAASCSTGKSSEPARLSGGRRSSGWSPGRRGPRPRLQWSHGPTGSSPCS